MRVLAVCFSHLPAGSLGCYGAVHFPRRTALAGASQASAGQDVPPLTTRGPFVNTPHFDRLAAQSVTFDNCFFADSRASLITDLIELNAPLTLLHDGRADPGDAADRRFLPVPDLIELREAALADLLRSVWNEESPRIVCLHSLSEHVGGAALGEGGLAAESNTRFEDDEPGEPGSPAVKRPLLLHAALTLQRDRFLGKVLEAARGLLQPDDLLLVTSTGGDRRASREESPEWVQSVSEAVAHLPLLIHSPRMQYGERCPALLQPPDVARFLFSHLENDAPLPEEWIDDLGHGQIEYQSESATAIRSSEWLFVRRRPDEGTPASSSEEGQDRRLFRKPEDLWEILDLAPQFPDVVERLEATGRFELRAADGNPR